MKDEAELTAQIRLRAFEGLLITVMLPEGNALKPVLTGHFNAILRNIDAAKARP